MTPKLVAAIAVVVLVASWGGATSADAAFCSCGYTSKEVRGWNNHYLATPRGQARITTAVAHEVLVNPPADAPFIDQTGHIVKKRSRAIATRTLAWFKNVYLKCPDKSPGCKAMRQCLIAAYTTYVVDRGAGVDKATAIKAATVACIVAAFQSLASGGRAHAEGLHTFTGNADRGRDRRHGRPGRGRMALGLAA